MPLLLLSDPTGSDSPSLAPTLSKKRCRTTSSPTTRSLTSISYPTTSSSFWLSLLDDEEENDNKQSPSKRNKSHCTGNSNGGRGFTNEQRTLTTHLIHQLPSSVLCCILTDVALQHEEVMAAIKDAAKEYAKDYPMTEKVVHQLETMESGEEIEEQIDMDIGKERNETGSEGRENFVWEWVEDQLQRRRCF